MPNDGWPTWYAHMMVSCPNHSPRYTTRRIGGITTHGNDDRADTFGMPPDIHLQPQQPMRPTCSTYTVHSTCPTILMMIHLRSATSAFVVTRPTVCVVPTLSQLPTAETASTHLMWCCYDSRLPTLTEPPHAHRLLARPWPETDEIPRNGCYLLRGYIPRNIPLLPPTGRTCA